MRAIRLNKFGDEIGVSRNTARKIAYDANAVVVLGSRCKMVDLDVIDSYMKKKMVTKKKRKAEEVSV